MISNGMKHTDIDNLGLYIVTDSKILAERDFFDSIEETLKAGTRVIQLREKNCSGRDFLDKAIKLRELTHKYQALLIVNDRVDIALLSNADGVHVGQSDLPVSEVRKLVGEDKIIGVSVRTVEEAKRAEHDGANYIGVGSMFPTRTKNGAVYVGIDILEEIALVTHLPIVVIGGLTLENIHQMNHELISGFAVVSAVLEKKDLFAETKKWIEKTNK